MMITMSARIWPDVTIRPNESETEWRLRMLLQNLQVLASDPETLIRAYPPMIPAADELVNDIDHHLELAERCVEEGLVSREALEKARKVDALISEMSGRHDPSLWTDQALRTREEWKEVRRMAREALAATD